MSINDFYTYVNKDWLDKIEIPKDKSKWSHFNILNQNNKIKMELT